MRLVYKHSLDARNIYNNTVCHMNINTHNIISAPITDYNTFVCDISRHFLLK